MQLSFDVCAEDRREGWTEQGADILVRNMKDPADGRSCPNSQAASCGFFEWADEDEDQARAAPARRTATRGRGAAAGARGGASGGGGGGQGSYIHFTAND